MTTGPTGGGSGLTTRRIVFGAGRLPFAAAVGAGVGAGGFCEVVDGSGRGVGGTWRNMITRGLTGEDFSVSLLRFSTVVAVETAGLTREEELAMGRADSEIPTDFFAVEFDAAPVGGLDVDYFRM